MMQRAKSLEETLILEKIESRRRRGPQRMGWLDGIIDSMDMSLSKLWETVKDRGAWRASADGVTKRRRRLSNRTELYPRRKWWVSLSATLSGEGTSGVFKDS